MSVQNVIVKAENLSKYYRKNNSVVKALDNVSVSIFRGEFVAVVGTSGSGKSTFLHMLGGLDEATEGKVNIAGQNIFDMKRKELTEFRRENIGFIFQSYNLLPVLNVYDNIIFPLELAGKKVDREYVEFLLKELGIGEKRDYLPAQLSGGQQQRVAIARALVMRPAIILADEPTGNLDSKNTYQVMKLLKAASEKLGQTVVIITHDMQCAKLCNRILKIEDGKIVDDKGNISKNWENK
ncbi:MAG: ABC transporter ATP-binding protein [Lachnospiraceae bacterium]|nr:ABC transporter ATP-binding protein [Lachnospiraceae bacterium]